eukprot:2667803-Heterocapsa_arctica.AAC.1
MLLPLLLLLLPLLFGRPSGCPGQARPLAPRRRRPLRRERVPGARSAATWCCCCCFCYCCRCYY